MPTFFLFPGFMILVEGVSTGASTLKVKLIEPHFKVYYAFVTFCYIILINNICYLHVLFSDSY